MVGGRTFGKRIEETPEGVLRGLVDAGNQGAEAMKRYMIEHVEQPYFFDLASHARTLVVARGYLAKGQEPKP